MKVKSLSRAQLLATPWTAAHQAPPPWDFPGKSTGVGCCKENAKFYKSRENMKFTFGVTAKKPLPLPRPQKFTLRFSSENWRRQWHPIPVLLPGKSRGRRSLVGCSPWGREESDTTERPRFYFSLSCIGEGNGNPPQCSCLENPRDGGAWWAAVYGVAQSWTRLSSSSSSCRE